MMSYRYNVWRETKNGAKSKFGGKNLLIFLELAGDHVAAMFGGKLELAGN